MQLSATIIPFAPDRGPKRSMLHSWKDTTNMAISGFESLTSLYLLGRRSRLDHMLSLILQVKDNGRDEVRDLLMALVLMGIEKKLRVKPI